MEAPQRPAQESRMPAAAGAVARARCGASAGDSPVRPPRAAVCRAHAPKRARAGDRRIGRRIRAAATGGSRRLGERHPCVAGDDGALSLPSLSGAGGRQRALLGAFDRVSGASAGLPVMVFSGVENGGSGPLDRLDGRATTVQFAAGGQQCPLPDPALGTRPGVGQQDSFFVLPPASLRLGETIRLPPSLVGNARGRQPF